MLKGVGDNSIVASICARNVTDQGLPDFGYRPAIGAIVDRLKEALQDRCLPRPLDFDQATSEVPCAIIESTRNQGQGCNCNDPS